MRAFIMLAAALLGLPASAVQAEQGYYLVVFASQADNSSPITSHTFATFIQATWNGDGSGQPQVQTHTISWMPASLNIVLLRRAPEPGRNLDLAQSLDWARSLNLRTTAWGPYRIKKRLYDLARMQKARLESGDVAYKALDRSVRPAVAINCIHAVSDIDGTTLATGRARGDDASRLVLSHFRRWIIDPDRRHDWLWESLGVDPKTLRIGLDTP
jgi:hypothetical protein